MSVPSGGGRGAAAAKEEEEEEEEAEKEEAGEAGPPLLPPRPAENELENESLFDRENAELLLPRPRAHPAVDGSCFVFQGGLKERKKRLRGQAVKKMSSSPPPSAI